MFFTDVVWPPEPLQYVFTLYLKKRLPAFVIAFLMGTHSDSTSPVAPVSTIDQRISAGRSFAYVNSVCLGKAYRVNVLRCPNSDGTSKKRGYLSGSLPAVAVPGKAALPQEGDLFEETMDPRGILCCCAAYVLVSLAERFPTKPRLRSKPNGLSARKALR